MEINITQFFNTAAPMDYSASQADIRQNAGADTWRAACDDSADHMMLDTDEKREAFRQYAKGFGAWSEEDITAWSDIELNALFIQMVSAAMRENDLAPDCDWDAYEANDFAGHEIFKGDDEQIYFYVGS